jgi:hypothetical protein
MEEKGRGMVEERQTMLLLRPIWPLCQVAGVVERRIAHVVASLRLEGLPSARVTSQH